MKLLIEKMSFNKLKNRGNTLIFVTIIVVLMLVIGFLLVYLASMKNSLTKTPTTNQPIQETKTQNDNTMQQNDNKETTIDMTLNPNSEWVDVGYCGVKFKKHPKFKNTLRDQPIVEDGKCIFGYNYNEVLGLTGPVVMDITIFTGYTGTDTLKFYLNKIPNKDLTGIQWDEDERDFIAGDNSGLVLNFEDTDTGDSIGGYKVYLIVKGSNLVAIKDLTENSVLRMFLTSV